MENKNIIIKGDDIIGYPKDLTSHMLETIKYLVSSDAENSVCTIIDCSHVLEELLDFDHDKLVIVHQYDDGTSGCEYL